MNRFKVSQSKETTPLPHYWEFCVGSCHAYTALRRDYQNFLKQAHEELGFQYVRFHGLFGDDMSVCMDVMSPGHPVYSFHNIDVIYDFLLSINMKPFIELGFMPTALASGDTTCFLYKGNITPPDNYEKWYHLISEFTKHIVERYGIEEVRTWFFEVWNEPNMKFFWAGTQEEYFRLYEYAVRAIKEVDPLLQVGGPATASNAWILEFKAYCSEHNLPIDFISTHHYPTSDPLGGLGGEEGLDIAALMKASEEERNEKLAKLMNPHYERGVMEVMTRRAKEESGELPLYYTEWNSAAFPVRQDEPYSAAFVIKTLADNAGLVEGYSFWTVSDIFEESMQQSQPFHNGFGMLTIHGIPKPVYHAYRFMKDLGTERLSVTPKEIETVGLLATRTENGYAMILYNHNEPFGEIDAMTIQILFEEDMKGKQAVIQRVDETHGNPKAQWIKQGEPEYPNQKQIQELFAASKLKEETILFTESDGSWFLELVVEAHSIISIHVKKEEVENGRTNSKDQCCR